MTLATLADGIGFVGAIIILAGFARNTWLNAAPDRLHHLANFSGAGLLALSLTINFNLPALCLELAWATIALAGLIRGKRA